MTEKMQPELLDATRAKLAAEAAKLQAEARKLAAEAARAEAEALGAEDFAVMARLQRVEAEREAAEAATSDWRNHTYWFDSAVSKASVTTCIALLTRWHRLDPDAEWTVVFNSPGGEVIPGMALFDFLSAHRGRHHITTVCRGYAASMAGILLQAGDHRIIGPQSYLMIHEISAGTGGKIGEIQDAVKFYETICDRVVDIFVSRSGGKCSKAAFVKNWKRQDWWLTSGEAVKFGFADEIA